MNSRDFLAQNISNTQFPKTFEKQGKPKMKAPDLPSELERDQNAFFSFDTSIQPPPYSTTSCFITENRNTDPSLLRSTMYVLPSSVSVFDSLNIPLTFVTNPFSSKVTVNELNYKTALRCLECYSFVNILTKVEGNTFQCNICKAKNIIKPDFDFNNPILKYSTVEYKEDVDTRMEVKDWMHNRVDLEYFKNRNIKTPCLVLGIDLNIPFLDEVIETLEKTFKDESFRLLYKNVAIFLMGDCITLVQDGKLVDILPDTETPFVPPSSFSSSYETAISFLRSIKEKETGCIKEKETGCIKDKSIKEKKTGLTTISLDLALNISLGLSNYTVGTLTILFTNSKLLNIMEYPRKFIDSRNTLCVFSSKRTGLEEICIKTTGKYFRSIKNMEKDFMHLCTTKRNFGVYVEVKTSDAIRKSAIYGNTIVDNLTYIELASMDTNNTLSFSFFYDESVSNNERISLQFIYDFYAYDGSHRILVLNSEFVASNKISDIYSGISFDTLFCSFSKYISSDYNEVIQNSKKTENMLCKFLKYYRDTSCKEASSTQFVLPDSTKLLPLLYQSLIKNRSFSNSMEYLELMKVSNLNVQQNLRYFYPRMFTFTEYYMKGSLKKMKTLRLSMSILESVEIYILENSEKIIIYVGKEVEGELKKGIFKEGSEENLILKKMIEEINEGYGYFMDVSIIEEGIGNNESDFIGYMVEDRLNGVPAYHDYICELHFKVQKV